MTEVISMEKVEFSYGKRKIIKKINLRFNQGEVVSLLGPNGSGKTTLLKIMLGFLQPATGKVSFEGRSLAGIPRKLLARQLAYVPQVHRDSFTYAVEDVVLMGRMPHHSFFSTYSCKDHLIATDAMERLGILKLRGRSYTEISGGERQLTLIARSLAQGAQVFIMDEPVNGLDYGNQMRLLYSIKELTQEGFTFIITTHFPDHALLTADRAILLKDGAVLADGRPQQTITRESIFALYRIDVDVVSVDGGGRVCMPAWKTKGCLEK